jgi:multiple sugar transport system substrate-binding protein
MKQRKMFVFSAVLVAMIFSFIFIFAGGEKGEEGAKKGAAVIDEEMLMRQPGESMDEMATRVAKALANGKKIELHVLLTWDPPGQALIKVIPIWEEATGIKVFTEPLSTIEMSQKVNLELASGEPEYDIIQYDRWIHKPVLENPNVLNLDPYIDRWDPEFDTMLPGLEDWGIADDGTHRGFVMWPGMYIMVYRADMINDPKEKAAFKAKYGYDYDIENLTWDKSYKDLAEFFTRDTDNDGNIDFWGTCEMFAPYAAGDTYMSRYLNYWDINSYPDYLSDPKTGTCLLNDSVGKAVFQDLIDVVQAGHMVPEILQTDWGAILGSFSSGRCAMAFQYGATWYPIQVESSDFKISGPDQVGFAHIPGIEGKPRSTMNCGWISFVTGNTDIPEIAYLFMLWRSSPKIDREMALTSLHGPLRKATYADPEVIEVNPTFKAQFEYSENLYTTPAHLIYEEENLILSNHMAAVASEEETIAQALKNICNEINDKWREVMQ